MNPRRVRRVVAAASLAAMVGLVVSAPRSAAAGGRDLDLLNLCPLTVHNGILECKWISRDANGLIQNDISADLRSNVEAQTQFRSLMSELGVVVAPRLLTPADTLGISGFQISADVGTTQISSGKSFWNGVRGVSPENPAINRPGGWMTTAGAFVRKGLWIPLPGVEVGAGAVNVLGSNLWSLQSYAKLALQEGFHSWPLPSLAVRASLSHLVGTSQINMDVYGFDASISKAFSIAGTARFEPFGGWNVLLIKARSRSIDATPRCDAYASRAAAAGTVPEGSTCFASQSGTDNDLRANFGFPDQDLIVRSRLFAGFKVRLSVLFLAAQYELTSNGSSRDGKQANGASDLSGRQQGVSGSAGFDF